MKKLLIGFIAGAAVTGFSILFSGCNHHDRTRAELYFTEQQPGDSDSCQITECSSDCGLFHVHHWCKDHNQEDDEE